MIDAGALLETYDLTCHRCGRAGADSFEDVPALEAHLAAVTRPPMPAGAAGQMAPFTMRAIQPADLGHGKPVHGRCLPGDAGKVMRGIAF